MQNSIPDVVYFAAAENMGHTAPNTTGKGSRPSARNSLSPWKFDKEKTVFGLMKIKSGTIATVIIITFMIYIFCRIIVGKVESGKAFELMKSSNFTTFEVSDSRFINDKTGFRIYKGKETLSSINTCIKKLEQVPDYRFGKLKTEKTAILSNDKYEHKFNIHYYENGIVLIGGGYILKDLLTNDVRNVGGKVFKSECLYHTINM